MNFVLPTILCLQVLAVILCTDTTGQDSPVIAAKTKDEVFEQYVGTLDNSVQVHQVGFQATMICDFDIDEATSQVPRSYRHYGLVADVENGKSRRIENVGWSIDDAGISWDHGTRLICNDSGAYIQEDPTAIRKIEKPSPGIMINRQSIYSPFGLIWTTLTGHGKGFATPTAMTFLESEAKLIDVLIKESQIECLYLFNDHFNALVVVFDKKFGGMPVELRALWRDKKFEGTQKLKPLTKIDPSEISRWMVQTHARAYWQKVIDPKLGDYWVPAIVDMREHDPSRLRRKVYYFCDWKIGKDVDRAIFDHKNFEKTKPMTIYAQIEIAHEYQARQNELDDKVIALKKKFKLN